MFPGAVGLIEPETRTAHYLSVDDSASELEIDMPGSGVGVDDTEPVFGIAEYTISDCGDAVCPFYLANLSAYNTTDSWDLLLDTEIGSFPKSISNIQVDLVQSTLGVQDVGSGWVAFAPHTLRFHAELTVSSCGSCSAFGNGTHEFLWENEDYVFAWADDASLTLQHTFDFQSGSATLSLGVVPVEHPPLAEHDLGAVEPCDSSQGLLLSPSHSLSSDVDEDIELELWWVDGDLVPHGGYVPPGSHVVSLEARDSRGAVHRTPDQSVLVSGGAC